MSKVSTIESSGIEITAMILPLLALMVIDNS